MDRAGSCTYSDHAGVLHMLSSLSVQLLVFLQDYLCPSVLTGCSHSHQTFGSSTLDSRHQAVDTRQ